MRTKWGIEEIKGRMRRHTTCSLEVLRRTERHPQALTPNWRPSHDNAAPSRMPLRNLPFPKMPACTRNISILCADKSKDEN